jgi:hypothetical protein
VAELITDTGPLVGWINSRDQWHTWCANVLESLAPPLITCEAVIAEASWQLGRSRAAVDQLYGLVDAGALRVVDLLPEHMPHLANGLLRRRGCATCRDISSGQGDYNRFRPLHDLPAIRQQADHIGASGQRLRLP